MTMHLDHPLLRLPRQYAAERIAEEVLALPASAWLPHPGKLAGNDAVPLITPGGRISNGFAGAMGPTEHLRACPYIMEIMADLGAIWGRSRLMGLAPGADVPEHVDVGYYWRTHLRIHIPIITSPDVRFTCAGETVHMAPGECWVFDSFEMHSVHNGGTGKRIHLVLDTVGGEGLWDLVKQAGSAGGASPRRVEPGETAVGAIAYEQINAPVIMSGWEVRCHVDYLLPQAPAGAQRDAVSARLDRFVNGWMAAWAQFGTDAAGVPTYRRLLDGIRQDLSGLRADRLLLPNRVPLDRALSELIFQVAVPAAVAVSGPEPRSAAAG